MKPSLCGPLIREVYSTAILSGLPRDTVLMRTDDWAGVTAALRTCDVYSLWRMCDLRGNDDLVRVIEEGVRGLRQAHLARVAAQIALCGYAGWPAAIWSTDRKD